MERKGTLYVDFEKKKIAVEYFLFYYSSSYFIDLTDKKGVRHRFKRTGDKWVYSSLKPLKWRYDFTVQLFNAMDAVLRELALLR